jgi:hypothetical protein
MTNTNITAEGRAILALLTTPMTVAMISRRASLSRSTVRTELRALANAGIAILVGNAWECTPSYLAREAKANALVTVQAASGEPAGERIPTVTDETNPNDAESARRDRGLPARDGTSK